MSKPSIFAPWASGAAGGDIAQPSTGQQAAGFTPTIAAPPYQWFNWALNWLGQVAAYMMERSIADYDSLQTYAVGDVVQIPNRTVYQCIATSPITGIAPPSFGNWEVFGVTWLPAAISTPLVNMWSNAFPSTLLTAMLAALGVKVNVQSTYGTFRLNGFQLCWEYFAFPYSGAYPTNKTIAYDSAFAAGSTPYAVSTCDAANEVTSVVPLGNTGCNIVPSLVNISQGAPPAGMHGTVIAIGAAGTG
jgi:hypothetical protein